MDDDNVENNQVNQRFDSKFGGVRYVGWLVKFISVQETLIEKVKVSD